MEKLTGRRLHSWSMCADWGRQGKKLLWEWDGQSYFFLFCRKGGKCWCHNEHKSGGTIYSSGSETDLCVLLSNALENALHACTAQEQKGTIDILAYEKNGRFFFQVTNPCRKEEHLKTVFRLPTGRGMESAYAVFVQLLTGMAVCTAFW